MGARKLTRWQKASALVPMAVLVGAWGAALTNTGLATASSSGDNAVVPDVPTSAFEQPASVQSGTPAGIDAKAGDVAAISNLSTNGIPAASLLAYKRAETLLDKADASCKLPWSLIAAIGRVESNHGRTGGNSVNADGISTPGIYGIPLNGANNTAKINDTDGGSLDNDSVYDRAVGPMQFIPGTWKSVGVDADGDKKKNPQDIDDAATSAGVYLCSGEGDLSTHDGASASVLRYNHSSSYVDLVLKIADKYAQGDFTQSPNGYTSSSVLTSKSYDQTLTPAERSSAEKAQKKAAAKKAKRDKQAATGGDDGTSTGGGTTAPDGSTTTPGTGSTGGDVVGGAAGGKKSTVGKKAQDAVEDVPVVRDVVKPVTGLLTVVEAGLRCNILYPVFVYPQAKRAQCIADLS